MVASFFRPTLFICCQFPGLQDVLLKILYVFLAVVGTDLETNYGQAWVTCPFQTYGQECSDSNWIRCYVVQKVSSQSKYMLGMEERTFLKEDEYGNRKRKDLRGWGRQ